MRRTSEPVAKAVLAGLLGGIAGTAAMAVCGLAWSALDESGGAGTRRRRLRRSGAGEGQFPQSEPRSHEDPDTPSQFLARQIPGVDTPRAERAVGSVIHFAFGAGAGAAYGLATTLAPPRVSGVLTSGRGLSYGTLVWLLADEIGVPLAGIAPPPHRTPARLHAYALAGHFAYGLALDAVRRLIQPPPAAAHGSRPWRPRAASTART